MIKKTLFLLGGIILVFSVILYLSTNKNNIVLKNETSDRLPNSNTLTMMYEIKAESGEYSITNDTSWPQEGYTFNETLSKCENGSSISWNNETNKVIMEANISDKCYVYFDKIPVIIDRCANKNMASCLKENYTLENNLYYHDVNLVNGAGDNSYRYAGANPNNYVCFGSDEEVCPEDNLYRIIGVFNENIKLIKNSSYTNSYWGGSALNYDNNWENSTLNTETLNKEFLENLESNWRNKIIETTWYIGGFGNGIRSENTANLYNYEVRNSSVTYDALIGLVYVSDYGFAASPNYWSLPMINYNTEEVRNNNWIFENTIQWTISKQSDSTSHAFFIDGTGLIFGDAINIYNIVVKPTFYLNKDIILLSGTGTQNDPYRIA